jgi:hypothetical protein
VAPTGSRRKIGGSSHETPGPPLERGPGQVAYHSNEADSSRHAVLDNDVVTIVDAWWQEVGALDPPWQTVKHLAHSLRPFMECGSPDERDIALEAIGDVAQRCRLSPREVAVFMDGLVEKR